MSALARTDTSIVARWWWTVDLWALAAVGLLLLIGALLTLAASPPVAERIGLDPFHFVRRQMLFAVPALALLLAVSLLSPKGIRRLALAGFVVGVALMAVALGFGAEIKGARRWINVAGLTLQPSEFVKPCLVVLSAWMFSEQQRTAGFPGNAAALLLFAVVLGLLVAQPDFGMAFVVTAVWGAQFFMAGLPLYWVAGLAGLAVAGGVGVYSSLSLVQSRIDRFLDPASGDSYQVDTALEAFANGGLFGAGPGEGVVKRVLPDAHTDFVFAVAGEEFGLAACLLILLLFAFITLRVLGRVLREDSLFVMLAAGGLIVEFGLQAVINMGVNLHLLPTKGMTLPFISYGGSSMCALAIAMGMVLALTRRRPQGMER